jgi:hypothetical protein
MVFGVVFVLLPAYASAFAATFEVQHPIFQHSI